MRSPAVFAPAAVFVAFACITPTSSYHPSDDDAAIAALARTWSDGQSTQLSLCEDVDAEAQAVAESSGGNCEVANVAVGSDRGVNRELPRGAGCGGCPFENEAFVAGTVTIDGLPANTAVAGTASLGDGNPSQPYAFPYYLDLACTDAAAPCTIFGTLEADGTMTLTLNPATSEAPAGQGTALAPAGAATCAGSAAGSGV